MCGIVGLFLKDPKLEPDLGRLLSDMMGVLSDRGPDSAGFAVFGRGETGSIKMTVRGAEGTDFSALALRFSRSENLGDENLLHWSRLRWRAHDGDDRAEGAEHRSARRRRTT